ncbi:Fc.00g005160.m01.CDS01 [Cosmosporella sp. VM-42]
MDNQQNANLQPPATPQDAADEARLEEAMQRLNLLHIKVRMLRDTIPRMIDPLVKKQPSPDFMFAAFMKAVQNAQADVKEFTELMRDDTSKEVFAQVQKSQEQNPMGIKPWRHTDHPDWFSVDQK